MGNQEDNVNMTGWWGLFLNIRLPSVFEGANKIIKDHAEVYTITSIRTWKRNQAKTYKEFTLGFAFKLH